MCLSRTVKLTNLTNQSDFQVTQAKYGTICMLATSEGLVKSKERYFYKSPPSSYQEMLLSDLTTSNSLKSWRYPSSFQTAISQKEQLIFPNYLTSHDRRSIPQNRQLLWADCHLYNGCHGLNAQCYNSVRSSVTHRGEREMSPRTWWTATQWLLIGGTPGHSALICWKSHHSLASNWNERY